MRMLVVLITTLILLLSLVPIPSAQGDQKSEEYLVYSAILRAEHQADKPIRLVVLRTSSQNRLILPGSDDQKDILKKLSPLKEETLKSYNSRNNTEVEIEDRFDLTAKVAIVDRKEISEIFSREGLQTRWELFYRKYPDSGGFIQLSRVGFDAIANQALTFVSHWCGGRCASGTYYFLMKENGEWKIKKQELVWVS